MDVAGVDHVQLFGLGERGTHVDEDGVVVEQRREAGDVLGGHPIPLLLGEGDEVLL